MVPAQNNAFAQDLFTGISGSYDTWARVLSLGCYMRWRRFLVSKVPRPAGLVLDVSTGRAGVAIEVAQTTDARVVGLDVTRPMLRHGLVEVCAAGLGHRVQLVQGRAEGLPFPEASFDTVVFTYLLRYVPDPEATLCEMARVLKPSGRLLSLEFGVPPNPFWRGLWMLHTRVAMPVVTIPVSPGWRRVGSFLGPSIGGFYRKYPLDRLVALWNSCGVGQVQVKRLSVGGAVVMWGEKKG
ncbi:MAG: class I SAM-dependent methyltransferase [Chloroflexi bacterium]|nr:class I SAM-dependent methyltransferase [Chloroflexota bacterium]